jgi:hypothetical protein
LKASVNGLQVTDIMIEFFAIIAPRGRGYDASAGKLLSISAANLPDAIHP